jgi:hypothetical protein
MLQDMGMCPALLIIGNWTILCILGASIPLQQTNSEAMLICVFLRDSCSPNLSARLVLVESKDCQLAHVGLFASQDVRIF